MSIPVLYACLYSKYSNICKQLVDSVSPHVNFLKFLCVDNKQVRTKIINDKRFNSSNIFFLKYQGYWWQIDC